MTPQYNEGNGPGTGSNWCVFSLLITGQQAFHHKVIIAIHAANDGNNSNETFQSGLPR